MGHPLVKRFWPLVVYKDTCYCLHSGELTLTITTCACSHTHLFAEALQNELSLVKLLPSYNITSRGSIHLLDFYFVLNELE